MSLATQLAIARTVKVRPVLFIDGIPFYFGVNATTPIPSGVTNGPSATYSVNGIVPDSLSVDGREIDWDALMVKPGGFSVSIRADPLWNKYFERRRSPQTLLTGQVDESTDPVTLDVEKSTGFAVGDYIYCNRETMKVTSIPDAISLVASRDQLSTGYNRIASHNTGAVVSISPRHLIGRSARLWYAFGESAAADYQTAGTFVMASSPVYDAKKGTWELSFGDNFKFFDRKIAVGLSGSEMRTAAAHDPSVNEITWTPKNMRDFGDATDLGYAFLEFDGVNVQWPGSTSPQCFPITEVTASTFKSGGNLDVVSYRATGGPQINVPRMAFRIYVFDGSPLKAALKVLLSDRGDRQNHGDYDVLFGITSTGTNSTRSLEDGDKEIRFGAAVPAALVDVTGIESSAAFNRNVQGWFYQLGGRGEESLLDFLEEVAWHSGVYWTVNKEGKLTVVDISAAYEGDASVATIDQNDIAVDSDLKSVDDESHVVHEVTIDCNYGAAINQSYTTVSAVLSDDHETFREIAGSTKLERRGLSVAAPGWNPKDILGLQPTFVSLDQLGTTLYRVAAKRNGGLRTYKLLLPLKYAELEPGDRITLSHPKLNAFDGAAVSGMVFEVNNVKLDVKAGTVSVGITETWPGYLVAHTGVVDSWNGGTNTLTLKTSTQFGGGSTPGRQFAAGWKLHVYDLSAATRYGTRSLVTVQSVTDTTVVLTGAPSFTPAARDIVTLADYDNAVSSTTANAAGNTPSGLVYLAGANGAVGAADAAARLWG